MLLQFLSIYHHTPHDKENFSKVIKDNLLKKYLQI